MKKRHLDFLFGVPLVWFLGLFVKKNTSIPDHPQKILLIKLAAVGDTIILVPPIRSLRKIFPDAQIDFLGSPINKPILQTIPYLNTLRILKSFGLGNIWGVLGQIRKEKYDIVVDLEQWARGTALMTFFMGKAVTIGFSTEGQYRDSIFSHTFIKQFDDHEIYDFFDVLSLIKPLERNAELELWETDGGKKEADDLLALMGNKEKKKKRVLIHPGCGSDGKPREWPLENYALLINWLIRNYEAQIILTGGPEEIKLTRDLEKLVDGHVFNLGGKLSWLGTISLVKKVDLVISGNTGIMHIAAAYQKKQLALHGPTNPVLWGPLNSQAKVIQSPCDKCPSLKLGFEYHPEPQNCMKMIDFSSLKPTLRVLIDNP